MSVHDLEVSSFDSRPAIVLQIGIGESGVQGAIFDIYGPYIQDGNSSSWTAADGSSSISMGSVTLEGGADEPAVTVSIGSDTRSARILDIVGPLSGSRVTIRRAQVGTPLMDGPIVWMGDIVGYQRVSLAERSITCSPLSASTKRGALRTTWSRQCSLPLYSSWSSGCGVDPSAFQVTLSGIEIVNGTTIKSPVLLAFEENWFAGGYMRYTRTLPDGLGTVPIRMGVEGNSGENLVLFGKTDGIGSGSIFTVNAGCNHTEDHCANKFNNLSRYGGFPAIDGRSPFDGNPVF